MYVSEFGGWVGCGCVGVPHGQHHLLTFYGRVSSLAWSKQT